MREPTSSLTSMSMCTWCSSMDVIRVAIRESRLVSPEQTREPLRLELKQSSTVDVLFNVSYSARLCIPCIICLMSAAPFTLKMMRMAGRWSACMFPTLDLAVGPKHSSTISSSLSTRGREGGREGG